MINLQYYFLVRSQDEDCGLCPAAWEKILGQCRAQKQFHLKSATARKNVPDVKYEAQILDILGFAFFSDSLVI